MTTKAKEAAEIGVSETLYDSTASQDIPLTLETNGKEYTVRHQLKPLTDERYFKLTSAEDAAEKTAVKNQAVTTAVNNPKTDLWNEIAEGVTGYKKRDDFKDAVHIMHKKAAIDALLTVQFPETEAEPTDEGWDIDALVTVPFRAMFAGALIVNMSHSFRPESKAEMDEYLSIEYGGPDRTKLASTARTNKLERLADLGFRMLKETTGYVPGSPVPAWHIAETIQRFFVRQIIQAGKSLA